VADKVEIEIPFNHYITGVTAFTHKAGIHAKAILNNPETYEILDPADFGLDRYISIAHKLTGWNAVQDRAAQLGLELDPAKLHAVTRHVKAMADHKRLTLSDVDELLHQWADAVNGSDEEASTATQEARVA
jgi:homocitrate synthase